MPAHFNSILNERNDGSEKLQVNLLTGILQNDLQTADVAYANLAKTKFTVTKYIINKDINEKIGKTVITMKTNEEKTANEIIDVDLTLLSDEPVELFFEEKLVDSSDANEYYNVYTTDDERHFQIETVNRCVIEEDIVGSKQKVYLSAFPFQLNVFNNIDDFNEKYGFKKPIQVANTDLKVYGYAEDMVAVGGMFTGNFDEPSSLVIGKIISYSDVSAIIGGIVHDFTIIKIKTAFGILPVATSRETFDLSILENGKIIAMLANIKADFVK